MHHSFVTASQFYTKPIDTIGQSGVEFMTIGLKLKEYEYFSASYRAFLMFIANIPVRHFADIEFKINADILFRSKQRLPWKGFKTNSLRFC
jgi:hypothetical protein